MEKKTTKASRCGGDNDMYVIVVYDVSIKDNGQKRWRYIFKECKKYLNHVQNSVFEGELTKSQIFMLKNFMKKNIRADLDSVIFFEGRDKKWLDKTIYGLGDSEYERFY